MVQTISKEAKLLIKFCEGLGPDDYDIAQLCDEVKEIIGQTEYWSIN